MAVTYTLDHAGFLVVKVKAVGPHGAYCNEHPIPVNVEVWLGSPPPLPRRLASPHRLGRGRLVSLQVHFYEDDVLYLCDGHNDTKKKGLREGCRGYRLCIEARPSPPLRSRALPPFSVLALAQALFPCSGQCRPARLATCSGCTSRRRRCRLQRSARWRER